MCSFYMVISASDLFISKKQNQSVLAMLLVAREEQGLFLISQFIVQLDRLRLYLLMFLLKLIIEKEGKTCLVSSFSVYRSLQYF
jgi:hypothetical protein